MTVYIKNNTVGNKVWAGQLVAAGEYYLLQESEYIAWRSSSDFLTDIANGGAVVAKANDGTADIVDVSEAIKIIMGSIVETTPANASGLFGAAPVALYKPEEPSATKVSHDWTDKCTWYQQSIREIGVSLTLKAGNTYQSGYASWIDLTHGKVYMEDMIAGDYSVKVYDNGVELVEDQHYTVDYPNGEITIDTSKHTIVGPLTADFNRSNGSMWKLVPKPGKKLILEHSEIQFTDDINMHTPIRFEIWVRNPYFNPMNPTVEWTPTSQFGVDNFLQFPHKVIRYKNIKDIINSCNLGTGTIPTLSGTGRPVLVFPFQYITIQTLQSSDLAELRLIMDNDIPMGGTWGTITFYVISKNE